MDVNIVRGDDILQESVADVGSLNTNLWATVTGTPTYSGGVIQLNASAMRSLVGSKNFQSFIEVLIPTAPTAGDDRTWGFKNAGSKAPGAYFYIEDATFNVKILDDVGATLADVELPWDSDWTNAAVAWGITVFKKEIHFTANGSLVYRYQEAVTNSLPDRPLTVYISNANADVMTYAQLSIS